MIPPTFCQIRGTSARILAYFLVAVTSIAHADGAAEWQRLMDEGRRAAEEQRLQDAAKAYERAVAASNQLTAGDSRVAQSLDALASVYRALREYGKAEKAYMRALRVREERLGKNHPEVSGAAERLGLLYLLQGRFDAAETFLRRALELKEGSLGRDHLELATTLNNLASVHYLRGSAKIRASDDVRFSTARYFLGLLPGPPLTRPNLQPSVEQRSAALQSLTATSYAYQVAAGMFAKAEPLYTRALLIREKYLGPEHPEVASAAKNLGIVKAVLEKYDEAEVLLARSALLLEKNFGPTDLRLADVLEQHATVLSLTARGKQAEELHQRARQIREKKAPVKSVAK